MHTTSWTSIFDRIDMTGPISVVCEALIVLYHIAHRSVSKTSSDMFIHFEHELRSEDHIRLHEKICRCKKVPNQFR